jgi:thiol-disulfide isomerase/thioredoxin
MGKAQRNRAYSARERIAQQQAAAQKAEQRRRLILVAGSTFLVIVIVVAFIVIRDLTTQKQKGGAKLSHSAFAGLTTVPPGTLAKIGTGGLPATGLPIRSISDTALTSSQGKPEFLYIGAEFCPYCAAMRWSMAVALSRFGTFGPLKGIHSTAHDVYPNTATLTFYKQKYASAYLTFTPVENETVAETPLQPTTKQQQAVWVKYDTQNGGQGFPFMYFGGKVIVTGPMYSPAVLKGLTWSQITRQLSNPNSPVAQNVNGAANYLTAAICKMTNDAPADVCKAAPIPAIQAKI